jgi:hypothetical protein
MIKRERKKVVLLDHYLRVQATGQRFVGSSLHSTN